MSNIEKTIAIVNYEVKYGHIIPVYTKDPRTFPNAKKAYNSIWVEDLKEKKERCLLFTDNELQSACVEVYSWNLVTGRLYKIVEGPLTYYFVKIIEPQTKKTYIIKIPSVNMKKAEFRAYNSSDDMNEKMFWTDLSD